MPPALLQLKSYLKGGALSYAQIYFSNSLWFSLVLMSISFFDVGAGISGVVAITVCQLCSIIFNFNKAHVFDGFYSYNALMTGLAMGSLYQVSGIYFLVLIIASILAFFLTVGLAGKWSTSGMPILSIPFLITIWVVFLGLGNFSGVKLIGKETFSLAQWFPGLFSWASTSIDHAGWSDVIHIYLRSLSANIFQYNDLAGLILAIALLIRSRMAFALSVYGFVIGYLFYYFLEGDFTPFIYSYIGFNFILTAISLGGFFIVPSAKSHGILLLVIPITALLLSALHTVFGKLHLPLYSLPFNITVLLLLGALKMRLFSNDLPLVIYQQFSPEENHYKHVYYEKRFAGQFYYHLYLPVMGEWYLSQGYKGDITHKGDWQHALDFDVRNEDGKTFHGLGLDVKDYYCYDLPVLAPAAGFVVTAKDGISDNAIEDINLAENWGNTVIIKHAEGLYTKLSHLKPRSLKVKEGDYVRAGEVIAHCGSSGRSPEPHLHFQTQANPYIGSQTMYYPIAYFLTQKENSYQFHSFEVPVQDSIVRNVIPSPLLACAFELLPGKELVWEIETMGKIQKNKWFIYVDSYNKRYFHCAQTGAVAYFYNDGTLFYFTDFYGSKRSFLHQFYIAFHKVILGKYKGIEVMDALMPHSFFNPLIVAVQDFVAPFYHFMDGIYRLRFSEEERRDMITIETDCAGRIMGKEVRKIKGSLQVNDNGFAKVALHYKQQTIIARCVS